MAQEYDPVDKKVAALFDSHVFVTDFPGIQREDLIYRLFVPRKAMAANPGKRFPLLVWLHGFGNIEFGPVDYATELYHLPECVFAQFSDPQTCEFFILVVRCPNLSRCWFGKQPDSGQAGKQLIEPGEATIAIIRRLISDYLVDQDRISISGTSAGGTAAWEMGIRYPSIFSAIGPTSSSGGDLSRLKRLQPVPVWTFHSRRDHEGLQEADSASATRLQAIGGSAFLTVVSAEEVGPHNSWDEAYLKYGLLQWLLAQRRGQSTLATILKYWCHNYLTLELFLWRALPIVAVFTCFAAWKKERRRRALRALLRRHLASPESVSRS